MTILTTHGVNLQRRALDKVLYGVANSDAPP